MIKKIEQCGYKELEIPCGQNNHCDGYDKTCSMYITYGDQI